MTVDLKRPRPDVVYLRRRLKVGESPAAPVESTSTSSLSLSAPVEAPAAGLPSVPTLTQDVVLDASHPVVRLNRRQSAVGSLVLSHVAYVAWELMDGTTGYLYATPDVFHHVPAKSWETGEERPPLPEVTPRAFKNRPVVQFHKEMLLIGLRNVKHVKRVIAVPYQGMEVQAATIGGSTVTVPFEQNRVIYMSVVDSCVEFRSEKYRGNVHETFNIGTYVPSTGGTPVQGSTDLKNFFSGIRS